MARNSDIATCTYCGSSNVVKFDTFEDIQRWWCKDCKRKFAEPSMKTPLGMYFGGMPLDSVQRQLQMGAKAGVEFSLCHRSEGDKFCAMCDKEQRGKCEAIASAPRYLDD